MQNALPTPYDVYSRCAYGGLPVEVKLGSPNYSDCRRLGICRIKPLPVLGPATLCKHVLTAYLGIDNQTGRLLVDFIKSSITPVTYERFFSRGEFVVEADYTLSIHVIKALGLEVGSSYTIVAHTYPVLEGPQIITASFRLHTTAAGVTAAA